MGVRVVVVAGACGAFAVAVLAPVREGLGGAAADARSDAPQFERDFHGVLHDAGLFAKA